jgi:thiamine pyrophosphokinase
MMHIHFSESLPSAIICLNGTLPNADFYTFFPDCPIIAADGAANTLLLQGIIPSVIIGDLDSFTPSLLPDFSTTTVIKEINQEINDFEKSLIYALKNQFRHILIVGFQGGDLEHTLNNVSVLWKLFSRFSSIIIADLHNRIGIPFDQSFIFSSAKIGEIISLIPSPSALITTNGLTWNLQKEVLELSIREGARNSVSANFPEIHIHSGRILFFCEARFPLIPEIHI